MMRKCGLIKIYFALVGAIFFIFPTSTFSQTINPNDSINTGVIVVKRSLPSVSFAVKEDYDYSRNATDNWWERPYFLPWKSYPDTLLGARNLTNSRDTLRLVNQNRKQYAPFAEFGWNDFMNSNCNYSFSSNDTMKLDSARVEFYVDENGKAVCHPLFWGNSDFSDSLLEEKVFVIMKHLWLWYPAEAHNRGEKDRKIPCVVTLTIYAFDPGEEISPVIISQSNK
jgi:hypothetical protein